MSRVYYRDAKGCIIMFDLTNRNSFQNVLQWKENLDTKLQMSDGSEIPCILIANKVGNREEYVINGFAKTFSKSTRFEFCCFLKKSFVKWQPMNLDNGIQNAKKFGLRPRFASHEKHFRNSQNAFIYPPNRQAKVVPYLLEKIEFPFCLISYFFSKMQ